MITRIEAEKLTALALKTKKEEDWAHKEAARHLATMLRGAENRIKDAAQKGISHTSISCPDNYFGECCANLLVNEFTKLGYECNYETFVEKEVSYSPIYPGLPSYIRHIVSIKW